jgi:protoheme IX farnesyltransferase
VSDTVDAARDGIRRLRAFLELGKLRLSGLAVFAVIAGLYMGAGAAPSLPLVVATTLGTLLVAVGGNAMNMLLEREHDLRMPRTRDRPLPTGRLGTRDVLTFGLGTGVGGLAVLAATTNAIATLLCAAIFVTYVFVYTPLKRRTPLNTLVGAVPGALPPVVGYAAATGVVDVRAGLLFLILFLWQIPHFLAIAWRYRDDYARGGMRMLPVVDPGGSSTARQMAVYTCALAAVSLLPHGIRMAGAIYLGAAVCLNVLFVVTALLAAFLRRETAMRQTFVVSVVYLPLLLGIMVLDRTGA